jgi:hypothetical protein
MGGGYDGFWQREQQSDHVDTFGVVVPPTPTPSPLVTLAVQLVGGTAPATPVNINVNDTVTTSKAAIVIFQLANCWDSGRIQWQIEFSATPQNCTSIELGFISLTDHTGRSKREGWRLPRRTWRLYTSNSLQREGASPTPRSAPTTVTLRSILFGGVCVCE